MSLDEVTLRAYVDGELDPGAAQQVEAALAASEELQQQVQLMRASRLPYQVAFAAQRLPEMPQELRQRVESCIALSDDSSRELPPQRQ